MKFDVLRDVDIDPDVMRRLADHVITIEELHAKLARSKGGIRIKYGVDVTAPFMHLGHAVNLWLMRHFQDRGHKVVFLVGDFTTTIGDPTGKSKARPVISKEEIDKNAKDFITQVSSILRTDREVFEVRRNSEWYGDMNLDKFMSLLSMVTHARLIQRDMFQARITAQREIFMHELLYPVLQGYDSYQLASDMTVVGSDQLFNEMMGRTYQEKFDQEPQAIITTRITPGIDGGEKQSKSIGNYIAIADSPRDKFGKSMSIPDNLIFEYMEVYTELPFAEIGRWRNTVEKGENPMSAKLLLAQSIVALYHGSVVADEELAWFKDAFSRRQRPSDLPVIEVASAKVGIVDLVSVSSPEMSRSHIRRLIEQGAIHIDDRRVVDENEIIDLSDHCTLKVGKKKWFKMVTRDRG